VLDYTDGKGLGSYFRKISKKRAEVILWLERANSIYYLYLLPVLLGTKTTNIARLEEVRLMRWKLDDLDLIS